MALPSHAITTLHYVIAKSAGKSKADQTVDWLLANFSIAVADKACFHRARQLGMPDFEDAVVASLPEAGRCSYVVTRNLADFSGSTVPAIIPTDFLGVIETGGGFLTDNTASRG